MIIELICSWHIAAALLLGRLTLHSLAYPQKCELVLNCVPSENVIVRYSVLIFILITLKQEFRVDVG